MTEKMNLETGELPRFQTRYTNMPNRHKVVSTQPSRTKQEFKDECDINNIWANFVRTGYLDQSREAHAQYLDLSNMPQSYHESLNLVIGAGNAFSALPASERAKYHNNVAEFLEAAYKDPEAVFGSTVVTEAANAAQATTPPATPAEPTPAPPQGVAAS